MKGSKLLAESLCACVEEAGTTLPGADADGLVTRARRFREELDRRLRSLPERMQVAIGLHFCLGLELEDASERLGLSVTELRSCLGQLSPSALGPQESCHG